MISAGRKVGSVAAPLTPVNHGKDLFGWQKKYGTFAPVKPATELCIEDTFSGLKKCSTPEKAEPATKEPLIIRSEEHFISLPKRNLYDVPPDGLESVIAPEPMQEGDRVCTQKGECGEVVDIGDSGCDIRFADGNEEYFEVGELGKSDQRAHSQRWLENFQRFLSDPGMIYEIIDANDPSKTG